MSNVIKKVYFPRLILPLSGVLPGLVDFAMSFVVLLVLMVVYGVPFTVGLLAILPLDPGRRAHRVRRGSVAVGDERAYRDIREIVPFLIQILLFTSPILLPTRRDPRVVPAVLRAEPDRRRDRRLRGGPSPAADRFPWDIVLPGLGFLAVLLFSGLVYFRRDRGRDRRCRLRRRDAPAIVTTDLSASSSASASARRTGGSAKRSLGSRRRRSAGRYGRRKERGQLWALKDVSLHGRTKARSSA